MFAQPESLSNSYTESQQVKSRFKAVTLFAFMALFRFALSMSWSRALLKRYGPQPGSGPKEENLSKGFFKLTANATSKDGRTRASGCLMGRGDPVRFLQLSSLI
jgi:hypothetical protein